MGKKAEQTRCNIIEAALKLFAIDSYDNVSLKRIEEKAGLSRGALLYHFPTKENMFNAVVDKFLLKGLSVTNVEIKENHSFSDFIDKYLAQLNQMQKKFQSLEIPNMTFALVNLNIASFHYYKDFFKIALKWNQKEDKAWFNQLKQAITRNEIKPDIETEKIARSFKNLFYGTAYESMNSYTNEFLGMLKWQYYTLYNSLK